MGNWLITRMLKKKVCNEINNFVANAISNSDNGSELFMISADPLAKILVPELFEKYPQHQFVDCGSSLDQIVKEYSNREYVNSNTMYGRHVCNFDGPHLFI